MIGEALNRHGFSEQTLAGWTKGHPFKVQLALQLRTQTTVTLEWIARRLAMGSRGHLAQLLQKRTRLSAHTSAQPMLKL